MDRVAEDSQAVSRRTRIGLVLLGSLGPLSGLVIGYGVARALSQSIARVSVRLRDVHAHLGREIGSLDVISEGDLSLLDRQVDRIIGRVKEILEELDRQRKEVLRAEHLAAVGQLAAGVAHEIRNPLTGIKMLVDVAREEGPAPALTSEDLDVIHTEVARIERKVQSLLDYARPPAPQRRPVDLREAVQQALRLIHTRLGQQGVQLSALLPSEPVTYPIDADQFAGVLVNLFLNALDAMPQGGRLTVALEAGEGQGITVSVSDTGAGVAPSMQERLFMPFASNKPTGTGLGLHTSRRVVEQHGGRLLASNLREGGACFRIELPAVQEPIHAQAADR
jgi:signal transduction histidine kinase